MEITAADIRALVKAQHPRPVTSVYLDTDGARYPRAADYLGRLDHLLRDVRSQADKLDDADSTAVHADGDAIRSWFSGQFNRDGTRGVGVFASGGEIIDTVQTALSMRNIARVGEHAYVVPLEALLGRSHHIVLALVERDDARIVHYRLGRVHEAEGVESDVHGQHDQGGWSQANYQRSIDADLARHLDDVQAALRTIQDDDPIDALVVAGPQAEAAEFVKGLHPYLEQVRHGDPVHLSAKAPLDDLRAHLESVEQELVSARRRQLLGRLAAAAGEGEKAARGVAEVVAAANAKSIEVLFAVEGTGARGWRSSTGALAVDRDEAAAYGEPVEEVDDLVDEVIEEAVRSDAHLEFFKDADRLDGDPVAAILRF